MTACVAAVPAEAVPGAVELNVVRATQLVAESLVAGADVVLFPEAS
ncbi:hypothetical protein [uncultured Microbacterium sp.]|nr:hypothetical protein [uncultured Microbacterium sp.]